MVYLSEFMKAPFILTQDPASFAFDFDSIKPSVFNENWIVRYGNAEFEFDSSNGSLEPASSNGYIGIKSLTANLDDDNKWMLGFSLQLAIKGDASKLNPRIEFVFIIDNSDELTVTKSIAENTTSISFTTNDGIESSTHYTVKYKLITDEDIKI